MESSQAAVFESCRNFFLKRPSSSDISSLVTLCINTFVVPVLFTRVSVRNTVSLIRSTAHSPSICEFDATLPNRSSIDNFPGLPFAFALRACSLPALPLSSYHLEHTPLSLPHLRPDQHNVAQSSSLHGGGLVQRLRMGLLFPTQLSNQLRLRTMLLPLWRKVQT